MIALKRPAGRGPTDLLADIHKPSQTPSGSSCRWQSTTLLPGGCLTSIVGTTPTTPTVSTMLLAARPTAGQWNASTRRSSAAPTSWASPRRQLHPPPRRRRPAGAPPRVASRRPPLLLRGVHEDQQPHRRPDGGDTGHPRGVAWPPSSRTGDLPLPPLRGTQPGLAHTWVGDATEQVSHVDQVAAILDRTVQSGWTVRRERGHLAVREVMPDRRAQVQERPRSEPISGDHRGDVPDGGS